MVICGSSYFVWTIDDVVGNAFRIMRSAVDIFVGLLLLPLLGEIDVDAATTAAWDSR